MAKRHPANVEGDWFVDDTCIDCTAARTVAPGLIVRRGGQSVFARQPQTEAEHVMAWRARLLCPTASVRTETKQRTPENLFPEPMAEGVFRLGYNARHAAGAHSFLVVREAGNLMIDSPRWTRTVVKALEAKGGLTQILLSHRDDVADARDYAAHFGAEVVIHKWDSSAAPFATALIKGRAPQNLADDIVAIPLPGHTKGSTAYLVEETYLFTGDSLAWNFERKELIAWREFCWYSWSEQTASLESLLDHNYSWVFAGHGGSKYLPQAEMRTQLAALVKRMKRHS